MYHYVYRISNTVANKHYYGVRGSKEPRNDLGMIYFSSSTDKEFIQDQKENPHNYKYKIIKIFDKRKDAIRLEIKLHNKFNVGVNESFYNKAKQTSIGFDTGGIKFSEDEKNILYASRRNPLSDEHRKNISASLKGKLKEKFTEEHKENIKKARSKQYVCNNSIMEIYNKNEDLVYTVPLETNFEDFCKEYKLPMRSLKKSYQRNGEYRLKYINGMSKIYWDSIKEFEGWYCLKIK